MSKIIYIPLEDLPQRYTQMMNNAIYSLVDFSLYPKIWGLKTTDSNIDHRRVPNLMVFFSRFGKMKPLSNVATDYQAGDIVCWNLGGSITHIGIVVHEKSDDGLRLKVIHNIGGGQVLEDCLFSYKIIGHYSYTL